MRYFKWLICLLIAFSLCLSQARASTPEKLLSHFQEEAKRFDVPLLVLMAIAKTESKFNPWALNIAGKSYQPKTKEEALAILKKNRKKSYDVGIMQVNSWWLKKFNLPDSLAIEPSINIMMGAYILNHEISKRGGKLSWQAIGAYHSPTYRRQLNYYRQINKSLKYFEKVLVGEK